MSAIDRESPKALGVTAVFIEWLDYNRDVHEAVFDCIEDAVSWLQFHNLTNKILINKHKEQES
jgi:hypothetical protein